jgi:DNA-binding NarL/FixJ family response regulator
MNGSAEGIPLPNRNAITSKPAYSERTIKTVIQELTTRLCLRNRAHAVAHAVRNGWI